VSQDAELLTLASNERKNLFKSESVVCFLRLAEETDNVVRSMTLFLRKGEGGRKEEMTGQRTERKA
jgi:plasmid replication initiation protein